jgi:hypothetical protein
VTLDRGTVGLVVRVTGTAGEGALYPGLSPGKSGFTRMAFALVELFVGLDTVRG